MPLTSSLRILRVLIILMTLGGFTNTDMDYPATHTIDHLNTYVSFAILAGYVYSLLSKRRLVTVGMRAFLMTLIAFIWFSSNLTWSLHRSMHGHDYWRLDGAISFPTSLLIIIEVICTLRWEAKCKRKEEEAVKARQEQEMLSVVLAGALACCHARGRYGESVCRCGGSNGGAANVTMPLPNSLPLDEQDHAEVIIPANLQYPPPRPSLSMPFAASEAHDQAQRSSRSPSTTRSSMMRKSEMQRPASVYLPTSSDPSSSSSSHRNERRQIHTRMFNENSSSDTGSEPRTSEDLPPYSRV
ncbi:hypothetical protein BGZ99_008575 [Dissophora globulifera]|uniref:Uncharacterized protein n=1 Tax=Dissophora globulifera TaxID=979702 RepID=A0A9P6UPN3_9FUNG|nr:hypothetical protein BGZ99_008575 [Dissophora globulifera]